MQTTLQISFLRRFWQYQRERFPFGAHGLLVGALVWAMFGVAQGAPSLPLPLLLLLAWVVLTGFFLQVRIFDEHKDAAVDAAHRRELPVPRGLISLAELRAVAVAVFVLQLTVHAIWLPAQTPYFLACGGFLGLMGREFFIGPWLRRHLLVYAASHMLLLPLVALYAASLSGVSVPVLPPAVWPALLAVYFAGFMLEIGRKLRAPADERRGVETYSGVFGPVVGARLWLACVLLATVSTLIAAGRMGASPFLFVGIALPLLPAGVLFRRFVQGPDAVTARHLEKLSGLSMLVQLLAIGATG